MSLDVDLTRDALVSSTLSHGLGALGDRWTVQVLLGTFMGLRRFEQWQQELGIPRSTLSNRLRSLQQLDLLKARAYQQRPLRHAYHPTGKALAMYPAVLMMWLWERRWGRIRVELPARLEHRNCGRRFTPVLACRACGEEAQVTRLKLQLRPVSALIHLKARVSRAPRIPQGDTAHIDLGLRVDRWSLLIVTAVVLGCHYFDQLSKVLGIGPSVLSRRLEGMMAYGLLHSEVDRYDARRRIYRLTDSSRDLLGYIVCLSSWAEHHHLHEPSSIIPTHHCGHVFVPQVICSCCREPLRAWDVKPVYQARQAA